MSITVPPRAPETGNDLDYEQSAAEREALIEEARRRARRRRQRIAAVVLAALAAGGAAFLDAGRGSGAPAGAPVAESSPGSSATQSSEHRRGVSHGPEGGYVAALAIDPGNPEVVYAGGWGSVFKSTDGGVTWKNVTRKPTTRVTGLAIDPVHAGTVYATTDRGVSKTTDGGRSWHFVNSGLFVGESPGQRGRRLSEGSLGHPVIDAHRPATVFVGAAHGLFRTTNGGAHWSLIAPPRFRTLGSSMEFAIDPSRARTIYGRWIAGLDTSSAVGFYKSTDGGDNWQRIDRDDDPFPLFNWLALDPHRPGTIYGGDQLRGVIKSNDAGKTWHRVAGLPRRVVSLRVDPGRSQTIDAITETGALRSVDGGATWRPLGTGTMLRYGIVASDPRLPGTLYGADENGVVKSSDGGQTWRSANSGLVSTAVDALVLAPGSSKILYAAAWNELFRSADGGRTWRHRRSAKEGCSHWP